MTKKNELYKSLVKALPKPIYYLYKNKIPTDRLVGLWEFFVRIYLFSFCIFLIKRVNGRMVSRIQIIDIAIRIIQRIVTVGQPKLSAIEPNKQYCTANPKDAAAFIIPAAVPVSPYCVYRILK